MANCAQRQNQGERARAAAVAPQAVRGLGHLQAANPKLLRCFRARFGFVLGVDGYMGRDFAKLIGDVPASYAVS